MSSVIQEALKKDQDEALQHLGREKLGSLIQADQYVGEVFSLGYETALLQIHDYHRQRVGGIPSLCFLIGTRIEPDDPRIDYLEEDAAVVLLRVMDGAPLPSDQEALRIRVEAAQHVSGTTHENWDSSAAMDAKTNYLLSFAGVKCRVIGTFYLVRPDDINEGLSLRFGSDIANYYPNRGLKVYKPSRNALKAIVNYRDAEREDYFAESRVPVGHIRYSSTRRFSPVFPDVEVLLTPGDLLDQKSALFGMTRSGKSNTTKVILQSVFNLRRGSDGTRVGQLVFDPTGEYANENVQDENHERNPSCIKNVCGSAYSHDVVTYGVLSHPNDPGRRLMLLNFYLPDNLQVGKEIINGHLAGDSAKYIQNFLQVVFEPPAEDDRSAVIRHNRRVLVYRTLLNKAGFTPPDSKTLAPSTRVSNTPLFNSDLLSAMAGSTDTDFQSAARILRTPTPSWDQLAAALEGLLKFMGTPDYTSFDTRYIQSSSTGEKWADADLGRLLGMFTYSNGARQMGRARNQHSQTTSNDYADQIYSDLVAGRLVIVDQSSGEPEVNTVSADRIMWRIFRGNQGEFRSGARPPQLLVYLEEAHNLLPANSENDLQNVWVRTAKEGAKYRIGMVYATQEVSSIQKNILKNTANWFIGHLNNTDETKELVKYYDFADFEASIRRAQDKGFIRIKTMSNPFVVPAQVSRFRV